MWSPGMKPKICPLYPFLPHSWLSFWISKGTSTLRQGFSNIKVPSTTGTCLSPLISRGKVSLSTREAECKAQPSASGSTGTRFWDRRVLRQNAESYDLISSGRKWDANWSAPASLRDLHSPLLIRWSLGSNFFGGRISLLIAFSHQQEGYCSESQSLRLSWLRSQVWSKQNPLTLWMSTVQLLSFLRLLQAFPMYSFPSTLTLPRKSNTNFQLVFILY